MTRKLPSVCRVVLPLAALLAAACGQPSTSDVEGAISAVEVDEPTSEDASHLDGSTFTGDVAPGAASDAFLAFLEARVGAIVKIDAQFASLEGENESPPFFRLFGECVEELCPEAHIVIEGGGTGFSLDEETQMGRLEGTYGIEQPNRVSDTLTAWRLVANPLRRSELEGDGMEITGLAVTSSQDGEETGAEEAETSETGSSQP